MYECPHPAYNSRPGQAGMFCIDCGEKVFEHHDKPCSECAHFIDLNKILNSADRLPACSRKLITTEPDYYVVYRIGAEWTAGGLCFQPGDARTHG